MTSVSSCVSLFHTGQNEQKRKCLKEWRINESINNLGEQFVCVCVCVCMCVCEREREREIERETKRDLEG